MRECHPGVAVPDRRKHCVPSQVLSGKLLYAQIRWPDRRRASDSTEKRKGVTLWQRQPPAVEK